MEKNDEDDIPPNVIELTTEADEEKANPSPVKDASFFKLIFSGALPKTFWLIIGNEFCERFCFYGFRAILTLYLVEFMKQSNSTAVNVYHMFAIISYFTPIIGAIIADAWLGKYKTILSLSIVYAIGTSLMALLAVPVIGNRNLIGVIICLVIIACGTGGIKPCVSAFGADQFAGRDNQLTFFFNAFYIAINLGSFISTVISPLLRSVQCLIPGEDPECETYSCDCYALAFGVPALLMITAIVLFVCGTKWYIKNPPQGSILAKSMMATFNAIKNRIKKIKPKHAVTHWLDYASEKYDRLMLEDFKQVLSVSLLFLPLCFFWTLYDQTGSTWVIQGKQMYGKLGGWTITPDIIQAINPLLVIIMVPTFDSLVYPMLAKVNLLIKPLHRMVTGLLLAAVAFVVAGIIQVAIVNDLKQSTNSTNITSTSPPNFLTTRLLNNLPCELELISFGREIVSTSDGNAISVSSQALANSILRANCANGTLDGSNFPGGRDVVLERNQLGQLVFSFGESGFVQRLKRNFRPHMSLTRGFRFERQTIYSSTTTPQQSSIHILCQIVPYFILTCGEILFSVSGLHFAYSEADTSMKSVMTGIFLMTNSIGNLITLIINSVTGDQSDDIWLFFLYAALIVVVDGIFIVLVRFYVPREQRLKDKQVIYDDANQRNNLIANQIEIDVD